jgi:GT2 family glycosyltransferase
MMAVEPDAPAGAASRLPRIVCLILNTNKLEETLACLASLEASTYRNFKAIVLDVGPDAKLAAAMRERFPEAILAPISQNGGYAGNNNYGLRLAAAYAPDWVFLLNEDTYLAPDGLAELMAVGAAEPSAGMLGPTVLHASAPDLVQSAGGYLSPAWEARHYDQNRPLPNAPGEPRPATYLVGCSLLVRWAVFEQIGGLDEQFYIYYEEVDWCLRAAAAGWRLLHVPQARLWHKGVAPDYRPTRFVTYYSARNRLLLLSKHRAPITAKLRAWAEISRTLLSWTLRPKWRSMRGQRDALLKGVVDFLRGRFGHRPLEQI